MHHSWIWEQCLNQGILFCLSASAEVSCRERWLNNKSKVVCWEAATSKSFSNKVTNPSECHLEKVFCRRKGPNLFQAGSTILSPRLIDILLNRTFTTYSVHLLSSRALTDLTENRAHQRLFIYNLQIEKISGSFDFDFMNHFVQENRKMQL